MKIPNTVNSNKPNINKVNSNIIIKNFNIIKNNINVIIHTSKYFIDYLYTKRLILMLFQIDFPADLRKFSRILILIWITIVRGYLTKH